MTFSGTFGTCVSPRGKRVLERLFAGVTELTVEDSAYVDRTCIALNRSSSLVLHEVLPVVKPANG